MNFNYTDESGNQRLVRMMGLKTGNLLFVGIDIVRKFGYQSSGVLNHVDKEDKFIYNEEIISRINQGLYRTIDPKTDTNAEIQGVTTLINDSGMYDLISALAKRNQDARVFKRTIIDEKKKAVDDLHDQIYQKDNLIEDLKKQLEEKDKYINELEQKLDDSSSPQEQQVVRASEGQLDINGITVVCRESDGYVNATALCKAGNREFKVWNKTDFAKQFLKALGLSVPIRTDLLTKSITTGPNESRGTWVHPYVAVNIAQWLSPVFAVQVSKWIFELVVTGSVTLGQEKTIKELEKAYNVKIEELTLATSRISLLETNVTTITEEKDQAVEQTKQVTTNLKKLQKTHNALKQHKKQHEFKKGPCVYLWSNLKETDINRSKVGNTVDIKACLATHRRSAPYAYLHYLVYLPKHKLLEDSVLSVYSNERTPINHEFIEGPTPEEIISKITAILTILKLEHTIEDDLEVYNSGL